MKKQDIINATILGIVYHPEIRSVSDGAKADIAKMVKDLVSTLDAHPPAQAEGEKPDCYICTGTNGNHEPYCSRGC